MVGVAGRSGQKRHERVFRHALLKKLDQIDIRTGKKRFEGIAENLIRAAERGEREAIGMVMDRVDGRPKQEVDVKDTTDPDAIRNAAANEFRALLQRQGVTIEGQYEEAQPVPLLPIPGIPE